MGSIDNEDTRPFIHIRSTKKDAKIELMMWDKYSECYQVNKVLRVPHHNAMSVAKKWAADIGVEIR